MINNANLGSDKSYAAILSELAAVAITGEDALEFLSNQLSSDVNQLDVSQLQHSSWCNPKGRVLFSLLVCRTENGLYCFVDVELVEQFCQRLKMFVLRSAVTIEHISKSTTIGLNIIRNNQDLLSTSIKQDADIFFYPSTGATPSKRSLALVENSKTEKFVENLGLTTDENLWRYEEILLGHPSLPASASGAFLPQNLNLDALDGISFTKGCYPGQEIVARLKYRGKVKQRLGFLCTDPGSAPQEVIEPMLSIYALDDPEKKIGTTVASQAFENQLFISAVVEVAFLKNNVKARVEGCGITFSISPPPYATDN